MIHRYSALVLVAVISGGAFHGCDRRPAVEGHGEQAALSADPSLPESYVSLAKEMVGKAGGAVSIGLALDVLGGVQDTPLTTGEVRLWAPLIRDPGVVRDLLRDLERALAHPLPWDRGTMAGFITHVVFVGPDGEALLLVSVSHTLAHIVLRWTDGRDGTYRCGAPSVLLQGLGFHLRLHDALRALKCGECGAALAPSSE